jgi:opacity protein-like surface antigen
MQFGSKTILGTLAIGAVALLGSGTAQAERGYFGGNLAFLEYEEESISDSADLTAGYLRLGGNANEYVSGELRLGLGLGDDSVNVSGTTVDVELDTLFGGYIRGGYPVTEEFYPYVIAGITRAELTASVPGVVSISDSGTDTSFGLGADLSVTDNASLNVEYMSWYDKDGTDVSGFSLGASFAF